nr:putative E3 ubiquitin ligase [Ipomoea batatas]
MSSFLFLHSRLDCVVLFLSQGSESENLAGMASSQVQSSPFGCVLRDRNRRDRCSPNSKGSNSFQKNLKDLVHSCIPRQPRNFNSDSDENQVNLTTDLWVHKPQYVEKKDEKDQWNRNKASENWRKVKDVVFPAPESSVETPHLGGVSSLVRKWSDFETQINEESSIDGWESDRTPKSGIDSDATERERIRVADIIRKLSSSTADDREPSINGGNEAGLLLPRIRTSSDHHQPEQLPVLNSPRIIRGRPAFYSFLMQVERDRATELEALTHRKAVSKFQQKGRIQAVLRLKLLRHGAKARDEPPSSSTSPESSRKPQSSISHLRERFNAGVQHSIADSKAMPRKVPDSNAEAGKVSVSNQSTQDHSTSTNGNVSTSVGIKEENHPKVVQQINSDPQRELSKNRQENGLEIHHREAVDNTSNIGNVSTSYQLQERECLDDFVGRISPHREVAAPDPLSSLEEEALLTQHSGCSFTSNQLEVYHNCEQVNSTLQYSDPQHQIEGASNEFSIDWEEAIATSQQPVESYYDWDDEQSGYPQQPEYDQDWVIDVSRPRSEWEDLRQVRYQEMLDPFFENNDIRELVLRRSVSNFLSGSLRDKIDEMIMCHSQRHPIPVNSSNMQEEVRERVLVADYKSEEVEDIEEDKYDESGDEYEVDSQIREQPEDEAAEVVDHTWGHNQDLNFSIDSDQIATTSLPQSQSAKLYATRPFASSTSHPSIEVELIYELRGHMEQLHQEMSEIRRSIKDCMNMQAKLQKSIKHEVAAALNQSGQKSRRGSSSKHPSNENCCICSEMKIDSLLYRCGHMCTCFRCAHELVWGNGRCPICEAPILDIVRAVYAP